MKVLPVVPGEGRDVALPGAINTPADNRVTMEIGAAPIDIGSARACGMRGIRVRTGKYREEAVRQSGITPDLASGSLADLPRHL